MDIAENTEMPLFIITMSVKELILKIQLPLFETRIQVKN